ncbi:MAG TPA: winged helix DNA-binding domain-containing protein [Jiangellaceae bacterium]|nr:winged helix DNA-binding domain-containing protein [Jiangellaceae bacterium]
MTRPYTADQLRRSTLRRQFPAIRGRDRSAVVELMRRLGPVQSQAPRATFVGIAARLPGASYKAVAEAFDAGQLVKGTNLRGTVHVSVSEQVRFLDAVADAARAGGCRNLLRLSRLDPTAVRAELRRWMSADWRRGEDILSHMSDWLREHESAASAELALTNPGADHLTGSSMLMRRPDQGDWARRMSWEYRVASTLIDSPAVSPEDALVELTRIHLRAYGPATRADIAWWAGEGLTRVDAAINALGDELTRRPGPGRDTYLDLADPIVGGHPEPGVRLLPEYDGLVLGYAPRNRTRFVAAEHIGDMRDRVNSVMSPGVLVDGRVGGRWRLVGSGRRFTLEVRPFPGVRQPAESEFADPVAALAKALDIEVSELRLRARPR